MEPTLGIKNLFPGGTRKGQKGAFDLLQLGKIPGLLARLALEQMQSGHGVVGVENSALGTKYLDAAPVMSGRLVAGKNLDAVAKADIAAEGSVAGRAVLVLILALGIGIPGGPADDKIRFGTAGEPARQIETVGAELAVALVQVDAHQVADFSLGHEPVGALVIGRAGYDHAAHQRNAARRRLVDHAVGVRQAAGQRFLAENAPDARPCQGDDGSGIGPHRQDCHADIQVVVRQHLVPATVSGHAEAPRRQFQIGPIGVGNGDELAPRVHVEGAGARHPGSSRADEANFVFFLRGHIHSFLYLSESWTRGTYRHHKRPLGLRGQVVEML